MELILALFILSGTVTSLLVARQQNIRQVVNLQQTRAAYLDLHNALDVLEAKSSLPSLESDLSEEIEVMTSEEVVSGISVTVLKVEKEMPNGEVIRLERWVHP